MWWWWGGDFVWIRACGGEGSCVCRNSLQRRFAHRAAGGTDEDGLASVSQGSINEIPKLQLGGKKTLLRPAEVHRLKLQQLFKINTQQFPARCPSPLPLLGCQAADSAQESPYFYSLVTSPSWGSWGTNDCRCGPILVSYPTINVCSSGKTWSILHIPAMDGTPSSSSAAHSTTQYGSPEKAETIMEN